MNKRKKILITGSAGFIGFSLALNLLKKGHKIFFDSKQKEFENKINYWLNEISNIKKIKFEQNNI